MSYWEDECLRQEEEFRQRAIEDDERREREAWERREQEVREESEERQRIREEKYRERNGDKSSSEYMDDYTGEAEDYCFKPITTIVLCTIAVLLSCTENFWLMLIGILISVVVFLSGRDKTKHGILRILVFYGAKFFCVIGFFTNAVKCILILLPKIFG